MNRSPKTDELLDLLDSLLSGDIAPREHERLGRLLAEDDRARRVYFDYLDLHIQLRQWQKSESAGLESLPEVPSPTARRTIGSPLSALSIESPMFPYIVATVFMCVMLLSAWVYKITLPQPQTDGTVVAEVELSQPVFVGRITGMSDCRWSGRSAEAFLGAYVAAGSEYSLAAGLLEITHDDGAKVILEGPCEYEAESRRGGYLALGRLTARVEAGGGEPGNREDHPGDSTSPIALFSIRTPTAIVTDLGTEFGVDVDKRGQTTAQVFVGSVRLTSVAADGAVRAEQILSAGQVGTASAVGEMAVSSPAGGTTAFTRILPSLREARRAEADAYAKLVLSLGPVAYYRMERPEDEKDILTVFDSAPGGRHGKLSIVGGAGGSERLWCFGRFGGALRFRGEFFGDYVVAPRTPDIESNQYSFAAWVLADSYGSWSQIAGEGGSRNCQRLKLTVHDRDGLLRAEINQASAAAATGVGQRDSKPFPLGQWQHVAVVADGQTLHLYRNGVEEASAPCAGVVAAPPGDYLLLGCNNMHEDPRKLLPVSFWDGALDEVAVFHRALSADEVSQLYKGPQTLNGTTVQTNK